MSLRSTCGRAVDEVEGVDIAGDVGVIEMGYLNAKRSPVRTRIRLIARLPLLLRFPLPLRDMLLLCPDFRLCEGLG